MEQLLLSCKGLTPSTLCRFIPALSARPQPLHLSQFLNTRLNKNFKIFVNEYRIAKAKDLLIQDKDAKVLAIALDVGFKSKSTFNAAFLKVTHTTPTDYRKSN